jgi:hypothetical protein
VRVLKVRSVFKVKVVKMAVTGELRVLAIERLTGMSDYNSWAYAMQMYLIDEDLWRYGRLRKLQY